MWALLVGRKDELHVGSLSNCNVRPMTTMKGSSFVAGSLSNVERIELHVGSLSRLCKDELHVGSLSKRLHW